jgi:hypothetical protein
VPLAAENIAVLAGAALWVVVVHRNIVVVGMWVGNLGQRSGFVGSMVAGRISNCCVGSCIGLLGNVAGKGVADGGIGSGVCMGLCCSISGLDLGVGLALTWCLKGKARAFVKYMAR